MNVDPQIAVTTTRTRSAASASRRGTTRGPERHGRHHARRRAAILAGPWPRPACGSPPRPRARSTWAARAPPCTTGSSPAATAGRSSCGSRTRTSNARRRSSRSRSSTRCRGSDSRWDEGPFFQSERQALYREAADRLLAEGKAYRAFETPDELEALKKAAEAAGAVVPVRRPRRARSRRRSPTGAPPRAKDSSCGCASRTSRSSWTTSSRGGRSSRPGALDDFVLVRSDGHPLYHFTVCVDDVAMGITHVVRGVDHLPNAPKHVALFRALGAPCPVFAHLGMILGADGKKLSKRHGAAGVEEFRAQGVLPEALVNFLALLGWSPGEDRERMTLAEMTALFALERIGPSPSRFDHEKLLWMNGQAIQEAPDARLLGLLAPFGLPARDAETLAKGIALLRPRARTLVELAQGLAVYGDDPAVFDAAGLKKFGKPELAPVLRTLVAAPRRRRAVPPRRDGGGRAHPRGGEGPAARADRPARAPRAHRLSRVASALRDDRGPRPGDRPPENPRVRRPHRHGAGRELRDRHARDAELRARSRPGFHPRDRRRRAGRRKARRPRRDALPAGAERLPPHRPREVDLPELRDREASTAGRATFASTTRTRSRRTSSTSTPSRRT